MLQGVRRLSASAAGNRIRSLLRNEPTAILAHDRQFAFGGESDHVARRDGGIVDHDAGSLRACLRGLAWDVIEGRGGHFGNRRNVIEKGEQADAHGGYLKAGYVALSIDTRKVVKAKVVPLEPGEYGVAWETDDGQQGADRIGQKSEAEAIVRDINKQRAAAFGPTLARAFDA